MGLSVDKKVIISDAIKLIILMIGISNIAE